MTSYKWDSAKPLPKPNIDEIHDEREKEMAIWKYKASRLPTDTNEIETMLNSMPVVSTQRPTSGPMDDFEAMECFMDSRFTVEERAANFKDSGNECFASWQKCESKTDEEKADKAKHLQLAYEYYTKAIDVGGKDGPTNSQILSNRALVQTHKGKVITQLMLLDS